MNKKLLLGLVVTLVLVCVLGFYIYSQNQTAPPSASVQPPANQTTQSTQTAPTTPQTYKGVLPCADCSGIDTTLVLNPDKTFELTEIYQGKNDDDPFVTKGSWELETGTPQNPQAQVYVLTTETGEKYNYLVDGANKLTSLDSDKNPIDAPFNLSLTLVNS